MWRGGIDLNPIALSDTDSLAWLRALIWPGQVARQARFDAAVAVAHRAVAPTLVRGDLVDNLDDLLNQVPNDVHLVVFHTAVLAYVKQGKREAFARRMMGLFERPGGFTWIANEAASVDAPRAGWDVQTGLTRLGRRSEAGRFVLSVNGQVQALTGPHGQLIEVVS